jgi:hypothetical protein
MADGDNAEKRGSYFVEGQAGHDALSSVLDAKRFCAA